MQKPNTMRYFNDILLLLRYNIKIGEFTIFGIVFTSRPNVINMIIIFQISGMWKAFASTKLYQATLLSSSGVYVITHFGEYLENSDLPLGWNYKNRPFLKQQVVVSRVYFGKIAELCFHVCTYSDIRKQFFNCFVLGKSKFPT